LNLRFPPSLHDPEIPDFTVKPTFLLYTWLGQSAYEFFDTMEVTDEEWDQCVLLSLYKAELISRMKDSGEQYDDRIIEVHWDIESETWKIMRMRDDKPDANHKSIVEKILISIKDGVEIDAVSFFVLS
jgi:mRNA guanylyltransferase